MSLRADTSTAHIDKKPRVTRDAFDEIVQIKVGPDATVFQVHKGLLCKAAPYFAAAFDGHFAEAQTQTLELPEEDVTAFSHFQFWLYTNNCLQAGEGESDILWATLIFLYIFAEVRDIPDLQNAVMDTMIDKVAVEKRAPTAKLSQIYERTHENSPLRRIVIDWLAHLAVLVPATCLGELSEENFPKAALVDLVFIQYALRVSRKAVIKDFKAVRSDYHVKPRATAAKP